MGRHKRTSPGPMAAPGDRSTRRPPARSGLLGASAAMAVGAVAMASGLIPGPGGPPGGYTFGGGDGSTGNLAQPDESPAMTAPVFTSPIPTPAPSATRTGPAAGGSRRPAPTAPSTASPSAAPADPASPVAPGATSTEAAPATTSAGGASPATANHAVATADSETLRHGDPWWTQEDFGF